MKLLNTAVAGLVFAASTLIGTANAGLIEIDLDAKYSSSSSDGLITYSETIDNSYSVASDATFTLKLWGDFEQTNENVAVTLEDLDLGVVLNNAPDDDSFDYSTTYSKFSWSSFQWITTVVQDGGKWYTELEGVTTIDRADWANIVSDGVVDISLQASNDTYSFAASGDISYDVPEPTSLAIFGLALFGLGARRFSK